MKSMGVTLQRTYLTKNCKKKHCATPAKLFNILRGPHDNIANLVTLNKIFGSLKLYSLFLVE